MKEIKLTQNKVALVDDDDFEYLNQFNWYCARANSNSYAQRQIQENGIKKIIHMQKVVLNTIEQVDHKDGNGLNNTKINLRLANSTQNAMNSSKNVIDKTSKYKGVHITKHGTYNVQLKIDYKSNSIGTLLNEQLAAKYYDAAVRYLYGEFAWCNFKEEFIVPKPIQELKEEIKALNNRKIKITKLKNNEVTIVGIYSALALYGLDKKTLNNLIEEQIIYKNKIFTYEP